MPKKQKAKEPSTYRFMCTTTDLKRGYHLDFSTKEEALQHAAELNDPTIDWYGIYELDPMCDYLKPVTNKRLIPHDDRIPTRFLKEREDKESKVSKKRK